MTGEKPSNFTSFITQICDRIESRDDLITVMAILCG